MKVRDIMVTGVITVTPDSLYEGVARLMHKNGVAAVPVVSSEKKLLGMLSEKDLFRAMFPSYGEFVLEPERFTDQESQESAVNELRDQPIEKFMVKKVFTIDPESPIMRAGGLMLAHKIHHLPVVEKGILVGMVTRENIFSAILKHKLGY